MISASLFEHFNFLCGKKKKSQSLQNYTISELPLSLTLTREGSNTLAAQRTQRNAFQDHPPQPQHTTPLSLLNIAH